MKGILKQLEKVDRKRKTVIIRHGQTALNAQDRIRGWSDVVLTPHGEEQAEKMGKQLKGSGIDILIASDLTRALQTANIISRESGIPIIAATINLRPWNVGNYTGKPQDEVLQVLKRLAIENPDKEIDGGESFTSFKFRCLLGVIAFSNEFNDKTIGFVAHHRNDRIIRSWFEAGCPDDLEVDFDHFFQKGIEPGTFDVLELKSRLFI